MKISFYGYVLMVSIAIYMQEIIEFWTLEHNRKQSVFDKNGFGTIVGVSHINLIKTDNIKRDLGIPKKIR